MLKLNFCISYVYYLANKSITGYCLFVQYAGICLGVKGSRHHVDVLAQDHDSAIKQTKSQVEVNYILSYNV